MKKGEHYVCECGAELEVLKACTCEQTQQLICTCGMPLKHKTLESQHAK
jgi:hypothetical protein